MIDEYVEQREATYFVRGSRVSLDSVVHSFLSGDSAESIRDNFPTLSLEQVYGAIAYYLVHQAEIDVYLSAGQEDFENSRRSQSHIADELRTHLDRREAAPPSGSEASLPGRCGSESRHRVRHSASQTKRGFQERTSACATGGMPDADVLALAAREARILVSHDFRTMPRHFRDFVQDQAARASS